MLLIIIEQLQTTLIHKCNLQDLTYQTVFQTPCVQCYLQSNM